MELEESQNSPEFWNDQEAAQKVLRELKDLRRFVDPVRRAEVGLEEIELLVEMGADDPGAVEGDLEETVGTITREIDALQFQVMLGGAHDGAAAYLQISAGAGGLDATDWAEILLRMYIR